MTYYLAQSHNDNNIAYNCDSFFKLDVNIFCIRMSHTFQLSSDFVCAKHGTYEIPKGVNLLSEYLSLKRVMS